MTYKDFVKDCMNLTTDGTQFGFWIDNCQYELKDKNATGVVKYVEDSNLTMTMAGVKKCIAYIEQKEQQVKSIANDESFASFKKNLEIIDRELQEKLKSTMTQSDSDPSTLFVSYSRKFEDIEKQMQAITNTLGTQNNNTDSKLFSTIINMIAILGIFVAISFAGFGSVSLVSKFEINMAEELLKSTFYIVLIGVLIYNFLLLLIFFILKIVNASLPNFNKDENYISLRNFRTHFYIPTSFVISKFLIVVDIVLLILAVALFVCSLIFG